MATKTQVDLYTIRISKLFWLQLIQHNVEEARKSGFFTEKEKEMLRSLKDALDVPTKCIECDVEIAALELQRKE